MVRRPTCELCWLALCLSLCSWHTSLVMWTCRAAIAACCSAMTLSCSVALCVSRAMVLCMSLVVRSLLSRAACWSAMNPSLALQARCKRSARLCNWAEVPKALCRHTQIETAQNACVKPSISNVATRAPRHHLCCLCRSTNSPAGHAECIKATQP